MRVTVCEIDPREGRLEGCLAALADHVLTAASDFLLLPELCFSPWLAIDREPDAARWAHSVAEHDRSIDMLAQLGARAVLGTRPVVRDDGERRNVAYLWDAATNAAEELHEKHYLPDEPGYWEASWYGRGPGRFELGQALGMRLGVQICTEMWFFEWARHYAALGAELLCVPRATPYGSTDKWLAGGRAAAVCAGAYCVSSNLWYPPSGDADCGGLAWVVDPEGEVLACTDADRPFATVEIDLRCAREAKSAYPRYVLE